MIRDKGRGEDAGVERAEHHVEGTVADRYVDEAFELVAPRDGSKREHERGGNITEMPGSETQGGHRRGVGPLEIVDRDQQRPLHSHALEQLPEACRCGLTPPSCSSPTSFLPGPSPLKLGRDWGEALYTGDVLPEEATATMLEMRNSVSPIQYYGLGAGGYCLDQTGCDSDEVDLVGHLGGYVANEAIVAHHRASGTTLVAFANVNLGDAYVRDLIGLLAAVLGQLGLT